jgi:hypothetical protein
MKPGVLNCCFCFQNALNVTREHLQFLKFLPGVITLNPHRRGKEGIWERRRQRYRWGGMDIRKGR